MEDGSSIGLAAEAGIAEGSRAQAVPDAMTVMVAHNRVLMERDSDGQPNLELIKNLSRLVADAPEHVVQTLFPGKPETVEL